VEICKPISKLEPSHFSDHNHTRGAVLTFSTTIPSILQTEANSHY